QSIAIGVASGAGVVSNATVSQELEAYVGANHADGTHSVPTNVHVGGGNVTIEVFRTQPAKADATAGGGALSAVAVQAMFPTATLSAGSRAYVRDGVDLQSGSLTVRAGTTATPLAYDSHAESIVLGIAGASGDGVKADASTSGTVEAFVGA